MGSVAGIPIRLHFTFLLFLAWLVFAASSRGLRTLAILIPLVFLCVLLHELGHALAAKRYGIATKDITLYPFGGLAMLQGRPKPAQEVWIAFAGPLVNIVLAALFAVGLLFEAQTLPRFSFILSEGTLSEGLFLSNLSLALFNLIPAFPMDGGRILRAVLALNMPPARATRIAAGIGQFLAIVLGFVGLATGHIVLMLIAFFVFVGAGQEVTSTVGLSLTEGYRVRDAMITRFDTLNTGDNLEFASQKLLAGAQQDFPVVLGEEVHGLLTRSDIVRGLAQQGPSAYVAGLMQRNVERVEADAPLEPIYDKLAANPKVPLLVFDEDRLVGLVTVENLSEFLMIRQATQRQANA